MVSVVEKPGPNPRRGRPFQKGNGGRRPGSKNRTTLVAESLLKAEEGELVPKAIELAKAGDVQMLKFLLDRILPKERPIHVDLPTVRTVVTRRGLSERRATGCSLVDRSAAPQMDRPLEHKQPLSQGRADSFS